MSCPLACFLAYLSDFPRGMEGIAGTHVIWCLIFGGGGSFKTFIFIYFLFYWSILDL